MINLRKKNILDWPLCESSDIMLALGKLKECLKKFRKQLLATFYLVKKIYCAKNKNEKLVIFLINTTQKTLFLCSRLKFAKKISDDKKIFSIKKYFGTKNFFNNKKVLF